MSARIESGIEHQLYLLIDKFPPENEWKQRFMPLLKYSGYATQEWSQPVYCFQDITTSKVWPP